MEESNKFKILSWNLCSFNPNQLEAVLNMLTSDLDVICLQEVNKSTIDFLMKLARYEGFYCLDFSEKNEQFYNITLIRRDLKILKVEKIDVFLNKNQIFSDKLFFWKESMEALRVDIEISGEIVPIVNAHLALVCGPLRRMSQLRLLIDNVKEKNKVIIAGDFNSFSNPLYLFFLLPLVRLTTYKELFIVENRLIRSVMNGEAFREFIRGITFPIALAHLDHIYIKNIKEIKSKIMVKKFGSDHFPIACDLTV